MQLSVLLKDIYALPVTLERHITRLILDSRHIGANDVFLAIKGTQLDGRQYIPAAIKNGAAAILVDADGRNEQVTFQQNIPLIPVYQLQQQLGLLAARFYNYPANQLRMIGVTGTNGKTSCTHFIAQILQSLNISSGVIGTLGSGLWGALGEAGLTTPDALTLQATLAQFVAGGAKAVAMEVSSHSIDQGRINHIPFEISLFTNLTQDHLDYHGSMAAYAAVKERFMTEWPVKQAIINIDDAYGKKWVETLAKRQPVLVYGLHKPSLPSSIPAVYADNIQVSLSGIRARVFTPWGQGDLTLPLIGEFNLSNALAVLAVLCAYGIPFPTVLQCLTHLKPVAGRMQTLGGGSKPLVVIDYAHTPDALEKALQALRPHTEGKLICVFGCGGDRDQGKRPLMARIAEQYADQVIVTNDNPRHEKPEAIAAQIQQGLRDLQRAVIELDRSKAIQNSIQWANPGDCILIAGKGAEHYQQMGDTKLPFDDAKQAASYLETLK